MYPFKRKAKNDAQLLEIAAAAASRAIDRVQRNSGVNYQYCKKVDPDDLDEIDDSAVSEDSDEDTVTVSAEDEEPDEALEEAAWEQAVADSELLDSIEMGTINPFK